MVTCCKFFVVAPALAWDLDAHEPIACEHSLTRRCISLLDAVKCCVGMVCCEVLCIVCCIVCVVFVCCVLCCVHMLCFVFMFVFVCCVLCVGVLVCWCVGVVVCCVLVCSCVRVSCSCVVFVCHVLCSCVVFVCYVRMLCSCVVCDALLRGTTCCGACGHAGSICTRALMCIHTRFLSRVDLHPESMRGVTDTRSCSAHRVHWRTFSALCLVLRLCAQ